MTGPRSETFTMLPQVYRGEQVPSPNIVELRGRDVSVESERPLPLHVDGTPIGRTPATFVALPQAIRLKI
jgi:diacylglycerol kinase family enzyme